MVEQYGWIVVSVIVVLVSLYNTILSIKDRNKKPIDNIRKEFNALDKTVATLTTSINILNDNVKEIAKANTRIHNDFSVELKEHSEKLIEHDVRISNIERNQH